ncbi:hypothetical protein NIES4073_57200 [Kalymmatonema gypsitolerans NIES-4073]|nr:hypothetical protein NIES4073_57200 [Scytonema sp. NIES-4073]
MTIQNQATKIIQIVPQLPPSINGLGDYALNLTRQLRKDYEIETRFIVGDAHWSGANNIEEFPVKKVAARSAFDLLSFLPPDIHTVLLHYVGYGYAKRGCPIWLVEALERWKSSISNAHLVTMFHEISAFGPIWTSAFWLSKLQKNLAARLVKISDHCVTSRYGYSEILHQIYRAKQAQIACLPVFSNIGEPECVPELAKRTRRLVVFGSRNARLQVYRQCHTALERTCQVLEIEEICDIGVPTGLELSEINGIPVIEKGVASAAEISNILLDSVAGFLNFPLPEFLAKSSIFAALCAHRLIPCMVSLTTVPIDGLQAGKHYWSTTYNQSNQLCLELGQAIADNAYAWYQTHNLSAQTKIFASCLNCQVEEESFSERA